jgi:hypothetical protein
MGRRSLVRNAVLWSLAGLLVPTAGASPAVAQEGVAQPVPGMRSLWGIWCAANGACLGVGSTPQGVGAVVVLRADGSSGPVRPVPQTEVLSQVVCRRSCIAVGQGGGQGVVVGVSRDGTAGTVHAVPGATRLFDVACTTTTCIATGERVTTTSEYPYSVSSPVFVVISNGVPGSAQPLPRGTQRAIGIDCPTSTTCLAVASTGIVVLTSAGEGLWSPRLHKTWDAVGEGHQTEEISCPSSTACFTTAAGFTSNGSGYTGHPAMRRVGADGSAGPVQILSSRGGLVYDISCVADATCTVVGQAGTQGLLIDVTSGVPGPAQTWAGSNYLTGVSCVAAATCGIVGNSPTGAVFGWHGPPRS